MRAGNTEIAARKPTASPCISNGGDILPDRTSVHPSRTPDAGNRREVAIRLTADVVFKPDVDWLEDVVGNPLTLAIEVHA